MDSSSNNVGANQVNRIIWLDPNMANNVMVNPEDLSIKVQFTATRKNRSIIYSGKETISNGGVGGAVTFIEGSYVNQESNQPSLTTRYTDAIALEVMNITDEKVDDFESLGIESIDIEFNTAYAPMIKIKFIDIRGNAILAQGNMSKYRMFFELPYPLFSLKVKGFYGKTVNYCLHMQKWNASFNSETGNFEIQAEFIGYTYALLTDMLMGLIRAAVRTKKGQQRLAKKKEEYGANSNLVISIDDMLGKLNDLSFSFKKISEDDDSVEQLNAYDNIEEDLKNIKGALDTLSTAIYDGQNPANNYFRSDNGGVLGVPIDETTTKKVDDAIKIYKETVAPLITKVNSNIADNSLKLNEEILNGKNTVIKISEINYSDLTNNEIGQVVPIAIPKSGGAYENNDEDKERIRIVLNQARAAIKTTLPNDTKINIYSLLRPLYHIDEKMAALKSNSETTKEEIGQKLANEAESIIGFEPTIRNIFRVFTISCEIFLEVLREVSVEAETDADGKRAEEFNKISGKINVNGKEITNKHIYPWPEYRQKKGNEGYVETWLGSAPGIVPNNIEEVVFVEEMLKCFMDVARFDNELDEQQAEEEQGGDIDSAPEQIKDPWFPISVVDTPPSGVNENPYLSIINSDTVNVDEVLRLLLMRGFLLLGISNYKSKLDLNLVNTFGQTEAANLYEAAKKTENGLNIIKQLQNIYNQTDPVKQTDSVLFFNGLEGRSTIKNPGVDEGVKKPIMARGGFNDEDYVYTYITNSEWDGSKFVNTKDSRAYIPINNNYDGNIFYKDKKLKSTGAIKNLASSTVFVSNPKNLFAYDGLTTNNFFIFSEDDGSHLFKIINKNDYESKIMAPTFGSDIIEKYKEAFGGKTLKPTSFKRAYIQQPNNRNYVLDGINPLGGTYAALEFKDIDYNGASLGNPEKEIGEFYTSAENKITTTLTAFYTQNTLEVEWPVGAYFALKPDDNYFSSKIPKNPKDNETYIVPRWARQVYITGFGAGENSKRKHKSFGKQKTLIEKLLNGSAKPYVPFIEFGYDEYYTFSLFGSALYNNQWSTKSKALLFLHCFPWQGVLAPGDDVSEFAMFDTRDEAPTISDSLPETSDKPTRILSIKSMFKINGAFVKAPKAWVLLIGAMLWRRRYRLKEGNDPIVWFEKKSDGTFEPLIGGYSGEKPSTRQFLYYSEDLFEPWGMYFNDNPSSTYNNQQNIYTPIDITIAGLPRTVKNELIDYFENWVEDETIGFKYFQKEFEIWYGRDSNKPDNQKDFDKYKSKWFKLDFLATSGTSPNDPNGDTEIKTKKVKEILNDNENLFNNYVMICSVNDGKFTKRGGNFQVQLELRQDSEAMDNLVALLTDYVYLQNVNPNVWVPNDDIPAQLEKSKNYYNPISADPFLFNKFLESFFLKINGTEPSSEKTEEDQVQQEIFGTTDDKTIKLIIYRTLSSINDKWINGTTEDDIFAQCPGSNINKKDIELANKYRSGATKAGLIDTFRFVDRAFWDIGDKFYININSVVDLVKKNYNQSFFDVVNKILTDNNFNFIPLPTFVNFNDISELKTVFTPYSYNDEVGFSGTGPSFVCCYVGQTSVNLDLGVDAVYPDDGLSLNMDSSTAGSNLVDELEDFGKTLEPGEFNVPVFSVNYGQQNQNYFRSVKLDQREFTETMESLQTIEEISQGGDKSKPTYIGNNLFNVYQTRSYSAEVEMMGSAMIQPMMYFQLNNIPMFRGAYLIYKVTHSIKPHSMTTTIKGNRVKKAKTPLVDKYTMYMNLLGGAGGGGGGSIRQSSGNYQQIVATLIENGVTNGHIELGKAIGSITTKKVDLSKTKFINLAGSTGYMITEAANALEKMLLELTTYMDSRKNSDGSPYYKTYKKNGRDVYGQLSSFYRSYGTQVSIAGNRNTAKAGTSFHGWGIAVDWTWVNKNTGKIFSRNYGGKGGSPKSDFDLDNDPVLKWLYNNSYRFGFINPKWARDGGSYDEVWHWEYHGKTAKCLMEKAPDVFGQKIDITKEYDSVVKNPKTPDGKEAVYVGCDSKFVKGDAGLDKATVGASREDMKVENLKPGFDVKFKKIITNGNYAGISITDYQNDWLAVASNYIARKETFTCCPGDDEGTLRAGYGTDKILVNGSLSKVNSSTVFTEKVAKETLVYQTKNTFAKPLEKNLGTSNWNKLNKYQKAALLSLTYNTGPNIFGGGYGAQIKEGIESNDFEKAAQGILNGPISGAKSGKVYPGLITRRTEEARLFLLDKNAKVTYV